MNMSSHRYEKGSVTADYLRAAAGVVICGGLMVGASPVPAVSAILLFLVLLFGVYGIRTWLRQATVIEVDETGIRSRGPLGRFADRDVAWSRLSDMRLRFYSVKRDRKDGWMQLIVMGDGGKLLCDSHIDGFETIARLAFDAAKRAGVELNEVTVANLKSMGLEGIETESVS
jgi:hypothetical protein